MNVFYKRVGLTLVVLTFAGCASVPQPASTPVVIEERSLEPTAEGAPPVAIDRELIQEDHEDDVPTVALVPPPRVLPPQPSSTQRTISSLQHLAVQQRHDGHLDQAAATLERALRVEPRNAELWYQLADLHFAQAKLAQAEQLATKSNTFAANDPNLRAKNWRLIARVREHKGDAAGAADAYLRADRYAAD